MLAFLAGRPLFFFATSVGVASFAAVTTGIFLAAGGCSTVAPLDLATPWFFLSVLVCFVGGRDERSLSALRLTPPPDVDGVDADALLREELKRISYELGNASIFGLESSCILPVQALSVEIGPNGIERPSPAIFPTMCTSLKSVRTTSGSTRNEGVAQERLLTGVPALVKRNTCAP